MAADRGDLVVAGNSRFRRSCATRPGAVSHAQKSRAIECIPLESMTMNSS